jgi:prepilin-type N-terminal cleavage/methylation domain-containing protein
MKAGGRSQKSEVRRSRAGVTLLEMLVVVAIVGLIIGVSVPSISAGLDSVRLRSATSSVAGFFNAAVTRAERRQLPVELTIAPGQNRIVANSTEAGFRRELKMPAGVSLEVPQENLGEESDGTYRALIMPGGTAPAFAVLLSNRHGSRRIVKLDPMTGYPHVESADKLQQ